MYKNKLFKIIKSELDFEESKDFIDYVLNRTLNNKLNTYEAFTCEIAIRYAFLKYFTDYCFTSNAKDYSAALSFDFYELGKGVNFNQIMMLITAIDKQIHFELSNGDFVDHFTLCENKKMEESINE